MTWTWSGIGNIRLLRALVVGALLLVACGSDTADSSDPPSTISTATNPPSSEPTTTQTAEPTSTVPPEPTTTEEEDYDWGLPSGPDSPAGPVREHPIYMSLVNGACGDAQADLDRWWDQMHSPRGVLLYQAAIDLCTGDLDSGRRLLEQATNTYGWLGLSYAIDGFMYDCEVFRSVQSVLEQQDRMGFECPEGVAPEWPDGLEDDPRTPEDESAVTETTVDGDGTTTSTDS
jgi:hypothetical protein